MMECEEVKKEFKEHLPYNIQCCESCHEDEDMGFAEDLWFNVNYTNRHICCRLANALTKVGICKSGMYP